MQEIINECLSAILQLLVFTLIPLIFFLFRKNKKTNFFAYIGFYKPTTRSIIYSIGISLFFLASATCLIFIDEAWKQAVLSPASVTGKIRLMGFSLTSVSILLIIALIKTSLSEEILFRGFIGKRLIERLGFNAGNLLQAIIFGIVHLLLFGLLIKITLLPLMIIFIFSSLAGWTIGLIKEKYANGSIIPGWIAHGLGNTLSYLIIAFVI